MKLTSILFAGALLVSGAAFAAGDHGHAHKPLHGGVVVEAKDMDYELVVKPDLTQLYLRDHGKPVSVSSGTVKLTLLTGADKQEVELKPVGGKFEAKGSFKTTATTKALATVLINGKSSAVRFNLGK
jgi:hypothetical protein